MGDVVGFKKKPKDLSKYKNLHFDEFCDFYVKNIDVVNSLANFVCLNAAKDLDIGKINEYDFFMLRETIMSMAMRAHGLHHPLQELTDDYNVFFGNPSTDDS